MNKETEESDKETKEVPIPEEFQTRVKELMSDVENDHQLQFIRECTYECQKEMDKKSKGDEPSIDDFDKVISMSD